MPLLKHAKKKLKQDKKRAIQNKKVKNTYKAVVKKVKVDKNVKSLRVAFKGIDKAVKKNIIHKNKAARMKSSLSKMVGTSKSKAQSKTASTTAAKTTKAKTTKKPAANKKATTKKK